MQSEDYCETGVISIFFLEDLKRIWALRDIIPVNKDTHLY